MKRFFFLAVVFFVVEANGQRNAIYSNSTWYFNNNWKFFLGNDSTASQPLFNDNNWRKLDLPHDWSIELPFDEKAPATNQGGSLPGGIGWYRKSFILPASLANKFFFIEFDGVYRNSEVWINGHYLGKRPNGYISFRYELTSWLKFGNQSNIISVKVDNSQQPNSRWYSGSGIYRNVRLVQTNKIAVAEWGSFVTTPNVTKEAADINVAINITSQDTATQTVKLVSVVYDASDKIVINQGIDVTIKNKLTPTQQTLHLNNPTLWSEERPYLYKVVTVIIQNGIVLDQYTTPFGIRYFNFDATKGFSLNGKATKIKGVCMHHDLGALGTAVNISAIKRQLQILKDMGCNAIRTAHNPPAPELLELCDQMGFLVMDEAFDMWKKKKNKFDYFSDFPEWHRKDLEDQVKRDRNHPSVIMWSIGNEIREQFDSSGISITKELVAIVKALDTTRPVTAALSEPDPKKNFMYQSGALDVVGLNYHDEVYADFPKNYPGQKFIAAETMSALASRGHYDMPSDSIMYWPQRSPMKYVEGGNKDFTVSAYDQVAAYWGSTHEQTWKTIKKYDFLSGLFVWTGFDYLGEPTPYPWPARSSYFGIVDLAGFPKDVYYMYQSEWTNKPVLHLFPHWNWDAAKMVDVWSYYNQADEVELYLNGRSMGVRKKENDELHVMWRIPFEPGTLKAVSRKNGRTVLIKEIKTAGEPAKIELVTDKKIIHHHEENLVFITVRILDKNGNLVPDASNLVNFSIEKNGQIIGVDNGSQISHQSFRSSYCKAFNGLALVIAKANNTTKKMTLKAEVKGLPPAFISIK
ncbi:MAG: beta-galactosidase GalB [Bacteroidota bacterium]